MAKVVIFGILDTAELAHYYLENDSEHQVVAFTVSKEYLKNDEFKGLPVVPFEDVEDLYPPKDYHLFAPMTAKKNESTQGAYIFNGKRKRIPIYIIYKQ